MQAPYLPADVVFHPNWWNKNYGLTFDRGFFYDPTRRVNQEKQMRKLLYERFGFTCYGCCEELHSRWHVVKNHHNLRRVSCSPWTDVKKMSAFLEDRYILSLKPIPTPLSYPVLDKESIRSEIRRLLEITKDNVVELIMKDNHTIGNNPENVVEWSRIAKEEAIRVAEM